MLTMLIIAFLFLVIAVACILSLSSALSESYEVIEGQALDQERLREQLVGLQQKLAGIVALHRADRLLSESQNSKSDTQEW